MAISVNLKCAVSASANNPTPVQFLVSQNLVGKTFLKPYGVIRSVAEVAECLIATRPRSEELRTVTEPSMNKSENQAMTVCA